MRICRQPNSSMPRFAARRMDFLDTTSIFGAGEYRLSGAWFLLAVRRGLAKDSGSRYTALAVTQPLTTLGGSCCAFTLQTHLHSPISRPPCPGAIDSKTSRPSLTTWSNRAIRRLLRPGRGQWLLRRQALGRTCHNLTTRRGSSTTFLHLSNGMLNWATPMVGGIRSCSTILPIPPTHSSTSIPQSSRVFLLTASTPDGKLILRAIAKGSENSYTSARLVSRETLSRDHGLLTATILSPCAEGIWPAFWLLPQEPFSWPTDGEIDIAETWNGDRENHSCLHWGQHHEPHKHRVLGTHIPDMHARPVRYELAWSQPQGQAGRLVWYIDGRAIMKAHVPEGSRPMREMTVLLNIAMGGNVCGGKLPRDGAYDMVVFGLSFGELPARFEGDWQSAPEGRPY